MTLEKLSNRTPLIFDLSLLQVLMGYIFFPLAFIMGSSTEPNWDDYIAETLKVLTILRNLDAKLDAFMLD